MRGGIIQPSANGVNMRIRRHFRLVAVGIPLSDTMLVLFRFPGFCYKRFTF
jgi:hypothetical protein